MDESMLSEVMCANKNKASMVAFGALLVVTGVVIKNTNEQFGTSKPDAGEHMIPDPMVGMGAFLLGWVMVAAGVSYGRNNTAMVFGLCAAIVGSVMAMKAAKQGGEEPNMILPAVFAGAWVLLGYFAGRNNFTRGLGVMAGLLVACSMLMVLPWQRENNVVDGPGMPMFVTAWMLLVLASSM
jgi:hypothetical protein